ncbi:rhodanese-related sulfurtransferase [Hoeflea sp. YIM 152468]|uniref:oxygen-dependent tRNA uridine(34) hydroxylase TrhO n=1 Tax=Hoeflea sp. YIM 152468 TaxID=3031759 RepID=UPI0023DC61F7|nr:rhodanese-related sulfurtransferase [Hoeflea sp. YIM 152468]MDF1609217.1 rhodanese-related sulfurtransferase [Hoeflea sp. YIM 152468]
MKTPATKPVPNQPVVVAALYHFARLSDHEALQPPLAEMCCDLGLKGTLLLAREGINGTIAGSRTAIDTVLAHLRAIPGLERLEHKESSAARMPFRRMKVRLKTEIVTMGVADIDPLEGVGAYVDPKDWNALISDPDTIVIDTRNDYEVGIGTFAGAINPETQTFREFPGWVEKAGLDDKSKPVAMFCTGGIRCEKATAFMRAKGYENVYHLKGGILKYLENVPEEESLWQGSCFVFDERVAVTHGLRESDEILCRACRNPVTPDAQASPLYEDGVSCPQCYDSRSEEDRERFRMRQRQMLAGRAAARAEAGDA